MSETALDVLQMRIGSLGIIATDMYYIGDLRPNMKRQWVLSGGMTQHRKRNGVEGDEKLG